MFRKSSKINKKMVIGIGLLIVPIFIWYLNILIKPIMQEIIKVELVNLATEAIYEAVQEELTLKGIDYDDLVYLHKDNEGNIVLMQANTAKINSIISEIVLIVENSLKNSKKQVISIPLGQLSGIYLFANLGPSINISVLPMGSVKVQVKDDFQSVGINQSRHNIEAVFEAKMQIKYPMNIGEAVIKTTVPLADSILIGDVPNIYGMFPWNTEDFE